MRFLILLAICLRFASAYLEVMRDVRTDIKQRPAFSVRVDENTGRPIIYLGPEWLAERRLEEYPPVLEYKECMYDHTSNDGEYRFSDYNILPGETAEMNHLRLNRLHQSTKTYYPIAFLQRPLSPISKEEKAKAINDVFDFIESLYPCHGSDYSAVYVPFDLHFTMLLIELKFINTEISLGHQDAAEMIASMWSCDRAYFMHNLGAV